MWLFLSIVCKLTLIIALRLYQYLIPDLRRMGAGGGVRGGGGCDEGEMGGWGSREVETEGEVKEIGVVGEEASGGGGGADR